MFQNSSAPSLRCGPFLRFAAAGGKRRNEKKEFLRPNNFADYFSIIFFVFLFGKIILAIYFH